VKASHSLDRIRVAFDDANLTADAGLVLAGTLAGRLGLHDLISSYVHLVPGPGAANPGDKAMTVISSALAGGEYIDDVDVLRSGRTRQVLGHGVAAPSTVGTFLRRFTWGHARQLDHVSGDFLARAWHAGAGPGAHPFTIDVDSTICETYGLQKQGGSRFTYTKVRGYHPLLAVAAGTSDVLHSRLRGGPANSGRGAAGFITETFNRVRAAGATGQLTLRADSGFYSGKVVKACRSAEARFSITVRLNRTLRAAIASVSDDGWISIPYWLDGAADVAETSYVPFGKRATPVRLIVRRVEPTPGSQLAFAGLAYTYHAFITDRDGDTLELEADHRRHAEVENTIRDLKYGMGLNHLPSGRFAANAAWIAFNVMAHNLTNWVVRIGLHQTLCATKTVRRQLFSMPGRIAWSGRRFTLHLPLGWPWRKQFASALENLRSLPAAPALPM
jgi:hypothetical protein